MPQRIQRKRIKGWKLPDNTIIVTRPGKWGNPFNWKDCDPSFTDSHKKLLAVMDFRRWLQGKFTDYEIERCQWILDNIHTLKDKNLCCWCKSDESCHADVLLELANK